MEWRDGEDVVVTWPPSGRDRVLLVNTRWDPSGLTPSTYLECEMHDTDASVTIPWAIVDRYLLPPLDEPRLDSVTMLLEHEVTETVDGDVTLQVVTTGRSREAQWSR